MADDEAGSERFGLRFGWGLVELSVTGRSARARATRRSTAAPEKANVFSAGPLILMHMRTSRAMTRWKYLGPPAGFSFPRCVNEVGLDPSTSTHFVAESRRVLITGGADGGARVKPEHDGKNGRPGLRVKPDTPGTSPGMTFFGAQALPGKGIATKCDTPGTQAPILHPSPRTAIRNPCPSARPPLPSLPTHPRAATRA